VIPPPKIRNSLTLFSLISTPFHSRTGIPDCHERLDNGQKR
jgi:hypothetical protein